MALEVSARSRMGGEPKFLLGGRSSVLLNVILFVVCEDSGSGVSVSKCPTPRLAFQEEHTHAAHRR